MLCLLTAAALGFSLTNQGRALSTNNEPCQADCDAGHDADCDQQDVDGKWTMSCDMHPTTSCDSDCHYPPPPPTAPWMGKDGTYPSPPPSPPPPEQEVLRFGILAFCVALAFLCLVCVLVNYGRGNGTSSQRLAYWCCCCLPSQRGRNTWYDSDAKAEAPTKEGAVNAGGGAGAADGALVATPRPTPTLTLPSIALK